MTEPLQAITEEAPARSRPPWHAIVTALLGLAVLALGGLLAMVIANGSSQRAQIGRQGHQITVQGRQITALETKVTSFGAQLASVQQTASNATKAHLGFCEVQNDTLTDSYGDTLTALAPWDISSPLLKQGVVSCPTGQFLSVVPGQH